MVTKSASHIGNSINQKQGKEISKIPTHHKKNAIKATNNCTNSLSLGLTDLKASKSDIITIKNPAINNARTSCWKKYSGKNKNTDNITHKKRKIHWIFGTGFLGGIISGQGLSKIENLLKIYNHKNHISIEKKAINKYSINL